MLYDHYHSKQHMSMTPFAPFQNDYYFIMNQDIFLFNAVKQQSFLINKIVITFYIQKMLKNISQILLCMMALVITKTFCQQQLLQEQTKKQILQAVQYKYLIFTQHCYDTFFSDSNWFHFECLKMTAVKLMGYGLVMGGAIIKFPQIIKIISLKSVKGLSFPSVVLQLSTNVLATGYCLYKGNAFSLYGENVFIGIQMLFMVGLFILFGKGNKLVYSFFFVLLICAAYYVSDPHHLPLFIIEHSITVQTILICTSRTSQILQVFRIKSTGSLALTTWALSLVGNVVRIVTILFQASHDLKFLFSIVSVAFLNATIVFQFYLYRNSKPKSQEKKE